MNKSIIRYILGHVLLLSAAMLLLPAFTGIIYLETEAIAYFVVAALCFILGKLITHKRPDSTTFYLKE
ncbi:MAG: TrkH family potassium uptake protein, partial [Lachnospiraceae bacterium]